MNRRFLTLCIGWASFCVGLSAAAEESSDSILLRPDQTKFRDLRISQLSEDTYEIQTTGEDPYFLTLPFEKTLDPQKQFMLSLEYISPEQIDLQVFFAPSLTETGSMQTSLPAAKDWTSLSVNLSESRFFTSGVQYLRLDLGRTAGRTVQIRNLMLRRPTAKEKRAAQERSLENQAKLLLENGIRAYLKNTYPCQISRVVADANTIQVRGTLTEDWDHVYLCQVPPDQVLVGALAQTETDPAFSKRPPSLHEFQFAHTLPGKKGNFTLELPRFVGKGTVEQDRLFSRWVIGRKDTRYRGNRYELLSHARWADPPAAMENYPEEKLKTKKGVGAIGLDRPLEDLDQLGIGCVTLNIVLNPLILPSNLIDSIPYELNGKTYSFNPDAVARLDAILQETARRDIVVAAIILIKKDPRGGGPGNPTGLLAHPKCEDSAVYAMANVSQPAGIETYQAVLDFLARRYSRPDKLYGRIHHWILHNEVDMGFQWTSAGPIGPLTYMDLYQKSMRIAYLTAQKYNPNAKVFISLTHYWNWTPHTDRGYLPRQLLEILLDQSRAEGDFPWAIAYHPYPQSLLEPKTWQDKRTNFTFETPFITPKNIEVLDAWVRQKRTFYEDQKQRTIWLSEQGLNSPDYSEQALSEQAAGMAYVWKKIKSLDSIEAFIYHNWVDNEQEDGLLLGLRKLPSENRDPKPIWHVYKALDTPEEDAACDFAKAMIGLETWDPVGYSDPILETNLIEY